MNKYPEAPCEECKGKGQLVHPLYLTTSSCWRCNGTGKHADPREAQEALKEQLDRIEAKLDDLLANRSENKSE
jgi:DnaJ-class molecular chaperone